MEPLSKAIVERVPAKRRWWLAAFLPIALCLTAGCVTTKPFFQARVDQPTGDVCQVVATWQPEVLYSPDPTHGGQPTPGIGGRLYLFGPEISYPLVGDGAIVVDLYDDTPTSAGKPADMIEEWRIDKETLKRLLRRDPIGWGYTLFLPWGTYREDITQIHMRVRFEPGMAAPLYTQSEPFVLRKTSGATIQTTHRQIVPGSQVAAQTPGAPN